MSRPQHGVFDVRRSRGSKTDYRRLSTPTMSMNLTYLSNIISENSTARVLSPPQTPRSPLARPDRLSLRLRSNSGLNLHTNDGALSQYTDYPTQSQYSLHQARGATSPNGSFADITAPNIGHVLAHRSAQASSRASLSCSTLDAVSALPFADLLGEDAFQSAMENPLVVRQFSRYCEDRGRGEKVEFLGKIREYNTSLDEMTANLASISNTYTSVKATASVNLPPMVSRPLNADMKRVAHSIIPSLEAMFFESKSHIEHELIQDMFPGFVKAQLTSRAAAELAGGGLDDSSYMQYSGLGTCFCITDAFAPGNPIVAASEEFVYLTGYPLESAVGQSCGSLQGPFTDPEAIRRLQIAIRDQRESVELLLNYNRSGEPFWNLLFLSPLRDSQGTAQYWLGAQVNISECISSRIDLVRALSGGFSPSNDLRDDVTANSDPSSGRETPTNERQKMSSTRRNKKESKSTSSKNWLFSNFRKPAAQCPPSPEPSSDLSDAASMAGVKKSSTINLPSQFSSQRFQAISSLQEVTTAYSHYMVLRYIGGGEMANQRQSMSNVRRKNHSQLTVAFKSDPMNELLSLQTDVSQWDVFQVLEEKANSPSINRAFKTNVRESIDNGEAVSLELLLERGRNRAVGSSGGTARPSTSAPENTRNEDRVDRILGKLSRHEAYWSHWTPLKDASGQVDWVILVIATGV